MAKDLKTIVKLDTKSAVAALDKLEKKINHINKVVNKTNSRNSGLTNAINNANKSANTLTKNVNKVTNANNQAATSASKIAKGYQKSNSAVSVLTKNLRTLISTYVGLMGAQAVLNTSDMLTSAENKLNYVNGGDRVQTAETMDKTYAAAQRSRGSYANMLSNVAKTMTLAGDSFQGNVDNAIRFQEIMSKAYTVGGASAAEQSSSMYQLVQALGSGILQGDELRSVREGAPIAYKTIEEFAQEVLQTEESLKELASQGKITSDIVVAAMMNAGEGIDQAFAKTDMTFAQAFNNIKNMATQAFTPVLQMLNDALNSDAGKAAIQGIGNALVVLANAIMWVMGILGKFFTWCSDNWYWLQYVVYAVILAIVTYLAIMAAQAVITGIKAFISFIMALSPLYLWIIVIGLVVAAIVWLTNSMGSLCEAIYQICMWLATAIIALLLVVLAVYLATGMVMLSIPTLIALMILAVVLLVVGAIAMAGEEICANVAAVVSIIWNIFVTLVAVIIQNAILPLAQAWDTFANFFGNIFNDPIATIIHLFAGLANGVLGILKTIASGIDAIFGTSLSDKVQGWMDTLSGTAEELANRHGNGTYEKKSDIVGKLNDTMSGAVDKFTWDTATAYRQGGEFGANIQNKINSFGDKLTGFSGGGFDINNGLLDPYDSAYSVGGAYNPSNLLNNISDNTDDIKDGMDLSSEDLAYLRRIAELEWKKEFTTAEIKVEMTNNNTVDKDFDLNSLAIGLRDILEEEMFAVANGVYS